MAPRSSPRICMYCGKEVGRVRKGEHVVQKNLGGGLTIKTVCQQCNNLSSRIDAELCSRSPLSVIASQVIDAHLWQVWDVDHSENRLLLEARPNWEAGSLAQYPQMVLDASGPQLRGDHQEILTFGRSEFEQVFIRSMLRDFRRHKAGLDRFLHFKRVERNQIIEKGYRLPPRLFVRMSIRDLADRYVRNKPASFILRYQTPEDRRLALHALDNWNPVGTFKSFQRGIGAELPLFGFIYDLGKCLRALMKMALNVLSHCCSKTPINPHTFPLAIQLVKGERPVMSDVVAANGFIHASDLEAIKSEGTNHSFRLLHMGGEWYVYSSFFGGRIGSVV
ncbi:MAG: hypothetical protein KDA84_00470 [Planctomycetaceae bacterium]|nr:hypothetical protein [Planctomycetaceae bacterium]